MIWDFIYKLFRKKPDKETSALNEAYSQAYENLDLNMNFTAIFANSIANKVTAESTCDIDGDTARAELIGETVRALWKKRKKATAQALGKGGVFLVPYVSAGKVFIDIVDQALVGISEMRGEDITSITICAERLIKDTKSYYRMTDYTLENNQQIIRTRIIDQSGNEKPIEDFPQWAMIEPEIIINNVERSLFAYLRSTIDNRKNKNIYGVPLTYGCDKLISEIVDHLKLIGREYKLTAPMLGLDSRMFANKELDKTVQDKDRPFVKMFYPGQDKVWEIFSPEIRAGAMYQRLDALMSALEKAVGTSRGILTEPKTGAATATEIKTAQYDTFCMVSDMRGAWESAISDVCYAIDVLSEYFGLTAAGSRDSYEIKFSWDYSMFESSSETWSQMSELQSRGGIKLAKLNQYVTGQSLEDAQAEIDEVAQTEPTLEKVLGMGNV